MSEAVRKRFEGRGKLVRIRDLFGIRYHSDTAYRARVDKRRAQRDRLVAKVIVMARERPFARALGIDI